MERPSKEPSVWTKKSGYGTIRSDTKPTKLKFIYAIAGIASILLPLFVIFSIAMGIGFEDPMIALYLFLLFSPLVGFGIWFVTIPAKISKEYNEFMKFVEKEHQKERIAYEKWEKEHPHWEAEEFFRQMRDAGFSNVDSSTQKEKLKLYIKSNNIRLDKSANNAVDFFNLGKQEVERVEKAERIEALKKEEKATEKKLTKYAKPKGRDKSIKYCNDKINEIKARLNQCETDIQSVKKGGHAMYSLGKQKEHDWATHGGIASGLAGAGAGVATAINIQNKNAQIREDNQNLLKATGQLMAMQLEQI